MYFATGPDLEEAMFGPRDKVPDLSEFPGESPEEFKQMFAHEISSVILGSTVPYPHADLGRAVYFEIKEQLILKGINPEGLLFISSLDTKADYYYYTDGILYLPSLHPYVVTIDLFNLPTQSLKINLDMWVDSCKSEVYNEIHLQSDLYNYKKGWKKWMKANRDKDLGIKRTHVKDFREYNTGNRIRPENHFIVTPYHLEHLKDFAETIAQYFYIISERLQAEKLG